MQTGFALRIAPHLFAHHSRAALGCAEGADLVISRYCAFKKYYLKSNTYDIP